MIRAFSLNNERLISVDETVSDQLNNAMWIDLIDPSDDERKVVEHLLKQPLAEEHELEDLEASARFFEDEDGLHLHSFFYCLDDEDYADIATVGFTIRDGRLFTIRERDLPAFRLYRMRSRREKMMDGNAYELLLDLLETKIEQLADVIENIYADLEKLSRVVLSAQENKEQPNNDTFDDALSDLTELEDASSKVRLCLMDTQRALSFLLRKTRLPNNQLEQARDILRDIESLQPHNESLFQKVNFLMQAAMGFINIEQNRIMKFFSVVSVMFLPATLVASTYGMNFEFMPELKFHYGYPMAIGLMICAAATPYIYFKRKGWL
ncbi:magnesium/cobalt transporter CorA [Otariodibacter sp.]|uniref:magnesium/cobalt transporter CorA n=1 Tax=Otariodibacter sp. TaxID=3030919 RepID=UPI00262A3A63|nr:magnesium/cobalt transporter CorA [Otariodibacter sp.]